MTHGNAGDAPAAARPAGVIVTDPPRAGAEYVDALGAYGVPTVHEAMGRTGCLGPGLRPVQQDVRIAGTAVTALCRPGDNLMIHAAVEQCAEGDILVVATTSPSTDGMFGELFATALHHRGVRGLVIDAGVRDTAELRAMGFPGPLPWHGVRRSCAPRGRSSTARSFPALPDPAPRRTHPGAGSPPPRRPVATTPPLLFGARRTAGSQERPISLKGSPSSLRACP